MRELLQDRARSLTGDRQGACFRWSGSHQLLPQASRSRFGKGFLTLLGSCFCPERVISKLKRLACTVSSFWITEINAKVREYHVLLV